MKLALGTVQFGLDYGIVGHGQVSRQAAQRIVELARASGVDTLDTAIAYGESEAVLGEIGIADLKVVTKLPSLPMDCVDVGAWVEAQVTGALARLRIPHLHGLLLHRPDQLSTPQGDALQASLQRLKAQGAVRNLGISIYSPEELDAVWPLMAADIVQCPYSVFDRRIETSGWLQRLKSLHVEVHARSVFLQGVLLLDRADRPEYFTRWDAIFDEFYAWLKREGVTPVQACLQFVASNDAISKVIVGVDSVDHFEEILKSIEGSHGEVPASLSSDDLDLLLPVRWS